MADSGSYQNVGAYYEGLAFPKFSQKVRIYLKYRGNYFIRNIWYKWKSGDSDNSRVVDFVLKGVGERFGNERICRLEYRCLKLNIINIISCHR